MISGYYTHSITVISGRDQLVRNYFKTNATDASVLKFKANARVGVIGRTTLRIIVFCKATLKSDHAWI